MNITPTFIRTRSIRTGRGPGIGQYGPRLDAPDHLDRIKAHAARVAEEERRQAEYDRLHGALSAAAYAAREASTPQRVRERAERVQSERRAILCVLALSGVPLSAAQTARACCLSFRTTYLRLRKCRWFCRTGDGWTLTEVGRKALAQEGIS